MRTLTLQGLQSLLAQETDSSWHCAITIAAPSMTTARFIQNTVDVVYGANTYFASAFELVLAQDSEESVPQVTIRVDNVGREIIAGIRQATTAPDIDLEIFRIDGASVVTREIGPVRYNLLSVRADALVIEGNLGYLTDFLNEAATKDRFTPSIAKALFS
ncbi:MAG TPA: DUF1833 family protein [Methylococcus sp.]|nr:DUF1833 family protein [Methylococcus sp.]